MGSNNENNVMAGAIAYPTSERNGDYAQPRHPRNLQGLLKFAMEGTKDDDSPRSSELNPLDEERRTFLEEALRSLTVNFADVLQRSIAILKDPEVIGKISANEDVPEEVLKAFQNAVEVIYDIDNAQDFYKIGGYSIFPVCMTCRHSEVRALACDLLAEVCQNNPFCQIKALESGLLMVLLHLAKTESGTALAKCIYAISCLTREFEPGYKLFISRGGCETLTALLEHKLERVRVKIIYLIKYFCLHLEEAREKFLKAGLIEALINIIKEDDGYVLEYVVEILAFLVTEPRVLDQCRDPKHGLKELLEQLMKNEDLHQYSDIFAYCETILGVMESDE